VLPNALESTALSRNVVKMLCDRGAEPRVAMRGNSMLPVLHEPMVLQLVRYAGEPKLGDVLVFAHGDQLIAHRYLMRMRNGSLVLAGDAMPGRYDVIGPEHVVGTVKAVWSNAGDGAERVDRRSHRARGLCSAIYRLACVRARQVWRTSANLLQRVNPRARPRPYVALFNALAAILQNDAVLLRRWVTAVDAHRLLEMSSRHLCGPILIDGLEALNVANALPENALSLLRKERWGTAMRTRLLRQQVERVIDVCNDTGAVPILLKGSARLFAGELAGDRHDSDDIDVLLPRDQIAAVTSAFHEVGYSEQPGTIEKYAPLHHTAPLFPNASGVPLELHHVLAPPGEVRARTDYASFAGHMRVVEVSGRRAGLLDDFAGAMHSAIHAREPATLRNLVILAHQLRRLTPAELDSLYAVADREDHQRHRLHAALYAASQLAGLPLRPTPNALRIAEWRMRRYDLPRAFSMRSDAIEWWIATSGRATDRIVRGLLPWEDKHEAAVLQPWRAFRYGYKLLVKANIVAFTAMFALLLPGGRREPKVPLVQRNDHAALGEFF
jgi:hypothetical protein